MKGFSCKDCHFYDNRQYGVYNYAYCTKQDKELEKSYASKCTYYIDREDSNLEEKLLINTFEEGLKLQETELALDYTDYVFNSNPENLYKEEDFNEDADY